MKNLISAILILSITFLQSNAQTPQLVDDITPGSASSSLNENIAYNGQLVFTAGSQLWITDGTSSGTQMLKSYPNYPTRGSVPAGFKNLNNKIYFVVNDSMHGRELWVTDGTINGTQIVIDINQTDTVSSIPSNYNDYYLTVMNGKLYFAANDGTHGTELWVSDGTATNTQMIKDINPTPNSGSINSPIMLYGAIAATSNHILFAANDGVHGSELWITDGTASGTNMVLDIDTSDVQGSRPQYFIRYNDKVIFTTTTTNFATNGIYISDGTSSGTFQLASEVRNYFDYAVMNNNFYFSTNSTNNTGMMLWSTDGTIGGTAILRDSILVNQNFQNIDIHHHQIFLTVFNNKLYFSCRGLNFLDIWHELWESDGTPTGTSIFKTFDAGDAPTQLIPVGGRLYVRSYDTNRVNLWYFDGTNNNIGYQVIYPGANSNIISVVSITQALCSPLTLVDNTLYFANNYDVTTGTELYKLVADPNSIEFIPGNTATLNIYPNPSANTLYVESEKAKVLCVYNILGNLVITIKPGQSNVTNLDISLLPAGLYTLMSLSEEGEKKYGKFIKN